MFRKIVTELAYSPALAGSLGEYIKRLRSERSQRQIGLIFVALALVVQLFATVFPPESANASNPASFIDGGIQSVDDYLQYYDQNTRNIKDLLTSLGITRADLQSATLTESLPVTTTSLWLLQNDRSDANSSYTFKTSDGKMGIAYYQPVETTLPPIQAIYAGTTATSKTWFGIDAKSGNLITQAPDTATRCSGWYSTSLSGFTATCPDALEGSLGARAILSDSSSIPDTVQASDRIEYTITIKNTGDSDLVAHPAINLEDALEYSRLLDTGNGEYNYDTKLLSWANTTLSPEETMVRRFIIQALPSIPSTPHGQYIAASYDCTMQLSFGTRLSTAVACPFVKRVESFTNSLIKTPKQANLLFGLTLLTVAVYFYIRSRQLLTELYIIRHNHLGGL